MNRNSFTEVTIYVQLEPLALCVICKQKSKFYRSISIIIAEPSIIDQLCNINQLHLFTRLTVVLVEILGIVFDYSLKGLTLSANQTTIPIKSSIRQL